MDERPYLHRVAFQLVVKGGVEVETMHYLRNELHREPIRDDIFGHKANDLGCDERPEHNSRVCNGFGTVVRVQDIEELSESVRPSPVKLDGLNAL